MPADPYFNAYKILVDELSVNHKGVADFLRRFLAEKDPERYKGKL